MAREQGDFDFSANFEVKKEGVLDARQLADDFADLLAFTASDYIPLGFLVGVKGVTDTNERGLYQCIDNTDLSNPASWERVGVGSTSVEPRTGTHIAFHTEAIYGSVTAETGNITFDSTNAKFGTVVLLKHNDSTEPNYPANFRIITGRYFTDVDNFLYMQYLSASEILVTINQEL